MLPLSFMTFLTQDEKVLVSVDAVNEEEEESLSE